VELPLPRLFESPTIAGLSKVIDASCGTKNYLHSPPLLPITRDQELPLSFAQQRLWFLDQMEPGAYAYNIPSPVRLTGQLNVRALEQSLNEIMRRHEALRTTFATIDECPVQVIHPPALTPLPMIDLSDRPEAEREAEAQRLMIEDYRQPFDLSHGPLLRACLLRLSDEEHVLLLAMHHIVGDAWSVSVLFQELGDLYRAFAANQPSPLAELLIQYADFALWQREWLQGETLERQIAYWQQQLASAPLLKLPTDRPRTAGQTYQGAHLPTLFPQDLLDSLKALSRREGVTLFMTLLAAFQTLLHRHTEQEDIVVGTDVAGRDREEIEGLIGFFINHLVLRTDLSGNPSFRELLRREREVTLGAYAHQDVPFDKLVEALKPERSLSHTPLFQALFVLQNTPQPKLAWPGLKLSAVDFESGTTKFDLSLFMEETEAGLVGHWVYKTDLFDPATIARLAERFKTLLGSIVAQPDERLNALEMISKAERREQKMEKTERRESRIQKLRGIQRKAIDLSAVNPIKTGYLKDGQSQPLLIEPEADDINLAEWASHNRDFIEAELSKHGALLFRGFRLDSTASFEQFASAICPELFGEYGDLPREGVSGKVYGSTPYPADKMILFHNESSHLHRWPMKIWFHCVTAAEQGGETPIVDCRRVYELLDPRLRERFAEKKLMYLRNYADGLDVDWTDFFRTTDKAAVEEYCRKAGIRFEWRGGGLRTRQVRRAVAAHPKTGEMVFFNQVQLHHIYCLDAAVRESLLAMFGEEDLPRHVYYGDGSRIEDSIMEEICAAYREAAVSFRWQVGDIMMLDNMLTAHGRNPYTGERKIVVAMGEMASEQEWAQTETDPVSAPEVSMARAGAVNRY
jgi:alpha-ketoglutarate-dependent taurine dioxygenase